MKYLIIITGPTGIGKTSLGIQLAKSLSTEIVSADSRQVYKELNIGTAVPSKEELTASKHHLIQHVSIDDYYNVSKFEHEALSIIENIHTKSNVAILLGGTGLYIDAVCKGIDLMPDPDSKIREQLNRLYSEKGILALQEALLKADPEYYKTVDLKNPARLIRALEIFQQTGQPFSNFRKTTAKKRPFECIKIALDMDREQLYQRINLRVDLMIKEGLVEEARQFVDKKHLSALKTVGYQELFDAFEDQITLKEGIDRIKNNSRKYARKQLSWIRRDKEYQWFEPQMKSEILDYIEKRIKA